MSIESMDAFKCLYVIDINARVGLTQLYIACLSCLLNVERANYKYKREWKISTRIYFNRLE